MKTLKYILGILAVAAGLSSCVGDLDVTPIDPAMNTADKALTDADDYFGLLAQCYTGFATSGSYGPNGANNISGVDGGFSQYYRGRYHLNGLTTDEAVCGWNDQTLQDLHGMNWTNSDVFVAAFYYRIFYQISACNEFIRQANKASISLPEKDKWIAEARALRALCWLDAIDNFGNVPFADETASVGSDAPGMITRADLFKYIESECRDLIDNSALAAMRSAEYGRADKALPAMVLAKLYLNAEVYTGEKKYQECADVLATLSGYSLHDKYNELFLADNDRCTDEFMFVIQQDGEDTQSYGVTNYLIFASTGGSMDTEQVGISSGWGGIRTTAKFYDYFTSDDKRRLFWEEGQQKEINDISDFTNGMAFFKFRNVTSTGKPGKANGFVDTDFPVFRYADALLMKVECALRGANVPDALEAWNLVRGRAGVSTASSINDVTLDMVLAERGRELYQEGWRRSDLVRFGKFTSGDFLWDWKGGVKAGRGVDSHFNIFPIPNSDKMANPNLVQNPGY